MRKIGRNILAMIFFLAPLAGGAQLHSVDYRYAPQWYASCISFPDDTCKTLVGPLGQLLYDFGGKNFFPYANERGFHSVVHVLADENMIIEKQQLHNARVPIVVTDSRYAGTQIRQEAFALATDYMQYGTSTKNGNREDIVVTTMRNSTQEIKQLHPTVVLNSDHQVQVNGNVVVFTDTLGHHRRLLLGSQVTRIRQSLVENNRKTIIDLEQITLQPGVEKSFLVVYDNGKPSRIAARMQADPAALVGEAGNLKKEVIAYWTSQSGIPYNTISIPDREIQNLVDASVRGIWQARERKHDSIAFQVGPTCYRGLWIVDGAFLLETATILGRGQDARQGIEYMLSFQQPDGGFRKMSDNYWKENGIVLWACVQHALLTQDEVWLKATWTRLRKTVDHIKALRIQSATNNIPLDDGLIPPGEIDGGLWGTSDKAEYSNTYWNLIGLRAMIQAAKWLGENTDAVNWQKEYDDFFARFRQSAQRDLATDAFGNKYIPIVMDPAMRSLPQRAQWTFCQAVFPGQLFAAGDPLMTGTMKMLDATLQEGMVMGTGWLAEGIWNYFASFYGHANLWLGDKEKAISSLYAFANHASPLYAWREEQNPRDLQARYVGDMPHNWGSAEFIRLVVHMLALDRAKELHLFEGMPEEWLQPGMITSLKKVNTVFGELTFNLTVNKTGKTATLNIEPLKGGTCEKIFVHLGGNTPVELQPARQNNITINLKP
ncbi:hypothetical protein [Flavihumibacter petaseus]|uniref:Glycosidase n=1 Tax=Flavihumibacter petaseus NBRC 106054 TaxID=1220578 RepID=A0A0E9N231_9BACT|nr:hypothetical protein [Flavihumibacter petaseus]GAO43365.1 hypothetical protein FPE01S_02_04700 [Flavihumibacter petaseus NBRC 106054]